MKLRKNYYRGEDGSSRWSTAGTLYQVLMDDIRTLKFKDAIEDTIRNGDVVADVGTGSGILACFAVNAGARLVYAIESDPSNYKSVATVIKDNGMTDAIELIQGDALEVSLPEKVDVVICELMSTALLDEPQVRVMNHANENFLRTDGATIPRKAVTFGECVTTNYHHYDVKLRVPQYEWTWITPRSRKLSETTRLFEMEFTRTNKEYVHCSGCMKTIRSGLLNGIRLSTRTFLTDDITHDSSMGFCPRVVIPTKDEFTVSLGDEVSYNLSYMCGAGYSCMRVDVSRNTVKASRSCRSNG